MEGAVSHPPVGPVGVHLSPRLPPRPPRVPLAFPLEGFPSNQHSCHSPNTLATDAESHSPRASRHPCGLTKKPHLASNWRGHPSRQARFAIRRQGPLSTPLVLFMSLTGGGGELSGSEGGTCVSLSSGLCIHNVKRITIPLGDLFIYVVISF